MPRGSYVDGNINIQEYIETVMLHSRNLVESAVLLQAPFQLW